jgi:hypothetical protein
LIKLRIYNEHGPDYSNTRISQEIMTEDDIDTSDDTTFIGDADTDLIDIDATDGILYNDGDTMMEIKYPENDIRVRIKER